jgi:signal transduction histidine kinase
VKNGMGIILMENGRPDSGLVVLKSILNALDHQEDSIFMGITYQNIGLAHMNANRYDSAMENLYKAEAIKKAQNNKSGLLFTNNSIADIHQKQGNDELGLPYLYKNLDILTEVDQLHQLRNTVWKLSAIYESLGKFDSAYFYLKEAKLYSDSLLNEENLQDRLRLVGSYDAKLKEKENLSLKTEIQSKEKWIFYIVIFSILLFTAIVFIYLYYRQKNKLTHRLIIQNKELINLNEEINNLVGIIAHDLKAPLSKIEGLVNIITMEGDLNSSQKDILEKIKTVNTDGKTLIKNLVEINQIEYSQNKIEAADNVELSNVLKEISDSYQTKSAQKEIDIVLSIKKEIHKNLHLEYFKRILDNLISNALKFSKKGQKVYISLTEKNKLPVITIKDEGPGISEEDQTKMFRKFQKLSAQPTGGEHSIGLGLSIVKLLSDKLGIDIEVESKLGEGTTFYLIFR